MDTAFKSVGLATLAVSGVLIGDGIVQTYKIENYCAEHAAKIDRTHKFLKNHLGKTISCAFFCQSPIDSKASEVAGLVLDSGHHEIIVQLGEELFYLISYGSDGLQICRAFDQDDLQNKRP